MSVKMYLGSSGAGKSHKMYMDIIEQSIDNPNKNYYIVVPEQFTMETQRDIVSLHPNKGTMNIDIVSFNRLAYRLFEEQRIVLNEVLDDLGKSIVLTKILDDNEADLLTIKHSNDMSGIVDEVKSLISELYQYDIAVDTLESKLDELEEDSYLLLKLKDIARIYREFSEKIDENYVVTEQVMDIMAKAVDASHILEDAVVCFDGFTGFTPIQYKVIDKLLSRCDKVQFAITIDEDSYRADNYSDYQLFYLSKSTILHIYDMAKSDNIYIEEPQLCDETGIYRFEKSEELMYLCMHIYRNDGEVYKKCCDDMAIASFNNRREEIKCVARQIVDKVKRGNYNYSDIAVVRGDLDSTAHYYQEVFEEYGIPYFIDVNEALNNNPCIETIRAVLDICIYDFTYEAVFRYLKSGITDLDYKNVEYMENHVLKQGIRGYRMYSMVWTDDRAEKIKGEFLGEILTFYKEVSGGTKTTRSFATALFNYCTHTNMEKKLLDRASIFNILGDYSNESLYLQIYEKVLNILDKMVHMIDENIDIKRFASMLEVGFKDIGVGHIPPTLDQVIVGDITRTRLNHIKILFVNGVNDGIIPSHHNDVGILNDKDKELLGEAGLNLAPTNKTNSYIEQLYIYMLLTKASDRLYVSFASVDEGGKELKPSYVITQISNMFNNLELEVGGWKDLPDEIDSKQDALDYFLNHIGELDDDITREQMKNIYEALPSDYKIKADAFVEGYRYRYSDDRLSEDVARMLYGDILRGSVSKMEQYARCPYAYFIKYGLGLYEREEYEVAAVDIGNILHSTMERIFENIHSSKVYDWMNITKEQSDCLVDECIEAAVKDLDTSIFLRSKRNGYILNKINRIAKRTTDVMKRHINSGSMEPSLFEKSFGEKDELVSSRLNLIAGRLQLSGKIDRVDISTKEDNVYVSIVDYKSGNANFDINKVYDGTQLQLSVYMNIVKEIVSEAYPDKHMVPAGMFYYHLSNPMVESSNREKAEKELAKESRLRGIVNIDDGAIDMLDRVKDDVLPNIYDRNGDVKSSEYVVDNEKFNGLCNFVNDKLVEFGNKIIGGDIAPIPIRSGRHTNCEYCDYSAICSIDFKETNKYRVGTNNAAEDTWSKILGEETDNEDNMDSTTE